ncbi:MAG: ABC transporter ATP-binding protein, partial [Phycisphaerae bacterium]
MANRYYYVVGVTRAREASAAIGGSMSGQDYNNDVYIPLETMRARMGDLDIDRTTGSFSAQQVELSQITLQIDSKDRVEQSADVIRESLKQNHRTDRDYS